MQTEREELVSSSGGTRGIDGDMQSRPITAPQPGEDCRHGVTRIPPVIQWFVGLGTVGSATLFVAGDGLRLALIPAAILAARGWRRLVKTGALHRRIFAWLLPMVAFLGVASVGIALSPFGSDARLKGLVQILGLSMMVLATLEVSQWASFSGGRVSRLGRTLVVVAGVIVFLGALQWLLGNILGLRESVDLRWINDVVGGEVWRRPGTVGPLQRVNSILSEPAHFARVCIALLGISFVRLGVAGRVMASDVGSVMPRSLAILVLAVTAVTGSMVGFFMAFVALLALILVFRPRGRYRRQQLGVTVLVVVLAVAAFAQNQLDADKFASVPEVFRPVGDIRELSSATSALAISANRIVALSNLERFPLVGSGMGSHPFAYEDEAATLLGHHPLLTDLNSEDAASLLLRLLSETGYVGTVFYLLTMSMILAAVRIQLPAGDSGGHLQVRSHRVVHALTVGYSSSLAGLIAGDLARYPQYYDALTWVLVACVLGGALHLSRRGSYAPASARKTPRAAVADGA